MRRVGPENQRTGTADEAAQLVGDELGTAGRYPQLELGRTGGSRARVQGQLASWANGMGDDI